MRSLTEEPSSGGGSLPPTRTSLRLSILTGPSCTANVAAMRAVALSTLQSKLSEYIQLAQEGETVLVTERDRVIARLAPPLEERPVGPGSGKLAEAIQKGWITPARRDRQGPPPRLPTARWDELSKELDEDRGER